MNNLKKYTKTILYRSIYISALSIVVAGIIIQIQNRSNTTSKVKGTNVTTVVVVEDTIEPQNLSFVVYPEKRIPATNNWGTTLRFRIHDCATNNILHEIENIITDNTGYGEIVFDDEGVTLTDNNFKFGIKGVSHLNKYYNNCFTLANSGTHIDFTPFGVLFAGDTSVISDNYVNSLDISNNVRHLYTADNKNDINQDGDVNSLDISTILHNLFLEGD